MWNEFLPISIPTIAIPAFGHSVLLVFGAPCQLRSLAGQEHGRTIPLTDICSKAGDSTAVLLSAPWAVRHDVAHQIADVVLQISDDVLDDVSNRDHAHDLARVQHW
jgi:hypothetical protein